MPVGSDLVTEAGFDGFTEALSEFLNAELSFPAYGQIPNPRPPAFVVITRNGGWIHKVTDTVFFQFEVWADTKGKGLGMVQQIRELLIRQPISHIGPYRIFHRYEVSGATYLPLVSSDDIRWLFELGFKHQIRKEQV
jgi:hypothetical protein